MHNINIHIAGRQNMWTLELNQFKLYQDQEEF